MSDLWEISHIKKRCGKFPKIVFATSMAQSSFEHTGDWNLQPLAFQYLLGKSKITEM